MIIKSLVIQGFFFIFVSMKTLIIHPEDKSTDFLSVIYQNMTDCIIVNYCISNIKLRKLIKDNDRIIMLGHGGEDGLYDFKNNRMIINSSYVQLLREKICICIWCNANYFVEKYKLNSPLYSGMIVSDLNEALLFCVSSIDFNDTIKNIDHSNEMFAKAIQLGLNDNNLSIITKHYNSDSNPVIIFNKENIFIEKIQ